MLEELRQQVCMCNLELPKHGLVRMTSGNVSGRDLEKNLVVIKPSGLDYSEMLPEHMVVVDLEGNIVEGSLKPSVDTSTHLYVYRNRPDVNGITHSHSPYATSFAALGQPIPVCLTTTGMMGGPIPLGRYVPIGGEAIGAEIVRQIGRSLAIIMQNHGVFTIGSSAKMATKMAIEVEEIAKITHLALLRGRPIILTEEQITELADMYYGIYGQDT